MRRLLVLALLGLVVSCASTVRDGAPAVTLKEEDIADVVPRYDPVTRAGNVSPYTVLGKTYHLLPTADGYREKGTASWYGTKFHGQRTSNGEIFDLNLQTAAHKTLPIPCYARVTNLENGRSTVVRINDRGPFHDDRIIDLSYAAAVKLGFQQQGTAQVAVEVIDSQTLKQSASSGPFFLQVGAFRNIQVVNRIERFVQSQGAYEVEITPLDDGIKRVRVGPIPSYSEAKALIGSISGEGLGTPVLMSP